MKNVKQYFLVTASYFEMEESTVRPVVTRQILRELVESVGIADKLRVDEIKIIKDSD